MSSSSVQLYWFKTAVDAWNKFSTANPQWPLTAIVTWLNDPNNDAVFYQGGEPIAGQTSVSELQYNLSSLVTYADFPYTGW